jgi:three-Cys-motif partner protein
MAQPTSPEWPSEPRVVIKHKIYQLYLECWMAKICQRFRRAVIVDGFAGPGGYTDGVEGSSLVVARTFLNHAALGRFHRLDVLCTEVSPERWERLRARVQTIPRHHCLRIFPLREEFVSTIERVDELLGGDRENVPVLWLLDPFDLKNLPFSTIKRCLANRRDEMLMTWFSDEVFRFCTQANFSAALDRYYGDHAWQAALEVRGEAGRKKALMDAYERNLGALSLKAAHLEIASKNATARYSIVFATHSKYGLDCWNPVRWKLDPVAGKSVSEKIHPAQGIMFSDTGPLRAALMPVSAKASTFLELQSIARDCGYTESLLRSVLDELADDGLAVRELPLQAHSPWPEESVIRIYPESSFTLETET